MTRITSTSSGSQPLLDRRTLIQVLLLGAIVFVATIGAGIGVVVADSTALQQQSAPTNNSSNESLAETVVANSSNVSAVSATTTTTNGSTTTPAVTNQSAANGTTTLSANTTTVGASTSDGSDTNTTATTTTVAVNESATITSENRSASGLQFAFPNQTTDGTSVTVREPRLPEGGFLVVHDRSYPQNGLGSVIGVSKYIAPNTTYNRVQIRLFDVGSQSFERSRVRAPTTMYVQAVLDTNNNQQYDALATTGAQDVSYLIDGSRPAVAGARIDVEQTLTTESQSGGLMDGFAPNQSQNQTPTTASSGAEPTTSGDGLRLNPSQGSGFSFGSIPRSIGDFGPLLVILAGLAVGLYIKSK